MNAPGRLLNRTAFRLAFLVPGALALLAGLDAALLLLGLPAPVTTDRLPEVHGMLMVFGFVGTVIVLERAVALRTWWAFTSPALFGLGGILMFTTAPLPLAKATLVAGTAVLCLIYLGIWRRQPMPAVALQVLGAILALAATVLWQGGVPVAHLVPLMTGFLVLTIVGERGELSRIVVLSDRALDLALASAVALAVTAVVTLLWPAGGYPLFGASVLAIVAWLLRFDVATRLVRARGLPRYIAACLLAGYFWLALAGATWLMAGPVTSGAGYDATVHACFLGFTLSMIMAHAPVILPAVLRKPLPYRPVLYLPVALLHVSLVLRIIVGDGRGLLDLVTWGGALNVVALLVFVVLAAASVVLGTPARARPGQRPPREKPHVA